MVPFESLYISPTVFQKKTTHISVFPPGGSSLMWRPECKHPSDNEENEPEGWTPASVGYHTQLHSLS